MKTNMKTKLFFNLAVLFIFTGSIKAQIFSCGIVGGVSTSAVRIEKVGNQLTDVLQGNNIYGFETGVYAKVKILRFYIKPMGLYNFSMGDIKNQNESNSTQASSFSMQRLEAPLLFGFRIIGPLSIEAGPVYNYIIQFNNKFNDNNINNGNNINIAQSSGIGYRVGLALEIKRLLIYASYSGVTINSKGLNSATFKEPYKMVFGLGIKIGKLGNGSQNNDKDKN